MTDRYGPGNNAFTGARKTENDGHVFSPSWTTARDAMTDSHTAMLTPPAQPAGGAFHATDSMRINPPATPQMRHEGIEVPALDTH
jgi:hypothetical protein